MKKELFIKVEKSAKYLGVSKPYAYKLVREMNEELKGKGFMTIASFVEVYTKDMEVRLRRNTWQRY